MLPRGSALVGNTRFVVQSIGVAVLATILSSRLSQSTINFQNQVQAQLEAQGGAAIVDSSFGLCETPGVPANANLPVAERQASAATQADMQASIALACRENLLGFEHAYKLTFYFAMLAFVLGIFLPGWPLPWAGRGAAASAE